MAEEKRRGTVVGLVFVGCIMIGLAIGIAYGRTDVGIMAGIGVGFLLMGILWALVK